MVLPFPHFLALDARAEVYSLQLSGLIKGRNSADWFDQQKHRHLNCTIESHFCSAREMSLVSRASAQMQIRLKSFRQTIQACARENTFQGNNWDWLIAQYADFSAKIFFKFRHEVTVCVHQSLKKLNRVYICWQINFFWPLNIYLSAAKHFLHSRPKGGIIILGSLDFSRLEKIVYLFVPSTISWFLGKCTLDYKDAQKDFILSDQTILIKESGWRCRIFPMGGCLEILKKKWFLVAFFQMNLGQCHFSSFNPICNLFPCKHAYVIMHIRALAF